MLCMLRITLTFVCKTVANVVDDLGLLCLYLQVYGIIMRVVPHQQPVRTMLGEC